MSALVRLYPAAWRARYGPEFEVLLADRPPSARDLIDILLGAVDARLSPQVDARPAVRRVPVTDRLAGGAAIAAGLIWSGTYLYAWLTGNQTDLRLPFAAALALALLSLPGRYVLAYARPVIVGSLAVVLSLALWFSDVLPWDPIVVLPIMLTLIGVLGPGALALAATRAGVRARDRWRLILVSMPWPVLAAVVVGMGFLPESIALPFAVACFLPLGIAWVATGVRIARGAVTGGGSPPPNYPASTIATAGGAA